MFWNEKARRWERHPDCHCQYKDGAANDPCYCRWLRPLDVEGKPIPYPAMDSMRAKFGGGLTPEERAALAQEAAEGLARQAAERKER